jgi:hypothetical protein
LTFQNPVNEGQAQVNERPDAYQPVRVNLGDRDSLTIVHTFLLHKVTNLYNALFADVMCELALRE